MAKPKKDENLKEKPEKKEQDKTQETIAVKSTFSLTTPEAIVMLALALAIDSIGLITFILSFLGIGVILSFIPDILGLIIIGGWMLTRTKHITATRRAKRTGKKILKRLGLSLLGELIPFFGDIVPCWTLAVFFELRNN